MTHIICTVTNDLSQDQRMDRICSSLSKAGYTVSLVGRKKPQSLSLPQRPYQQIRLNCFFTKGKFFYLEYNLRLLIFLLRCRCDIINAVDLDTIVPCALISHFRKKKLSYDAHEFFTETPEVVRRPNIQRIWQRIAQKTIPKADKYYTVGPQLAQIMGATYEVDFDLIRNLPLRRIKAPDFSKKETSKKVILYQGMLNEGRGLEAAVEMMLHLDGFELWLVGDGDIRVQLENIVRQNDDLKDKVQFHGFIAPARLAEFTSIAWLGLNLLENKGLSYYYSLANKAFDYIQEGLPSIQMAYPEYQSLHEKYDIFDLGTHLEELYLAELVMTLSTDKARYKALQMNCYEAANELIWEKEEVKLLAIYEDLVNK